MASLLAQGYPGFTIAHLGTTTHRWQVTALDFSAAALAHGRSMELVVAEERPRAVAGTGVDAVIRARRRT